MPEGMSVILLKTHTHTHTNTMVTARNMFILFIGILLCWGKKVREIVKNYMENIF